LLEREPEPPAAAPVPGAAAARWLPDLDALRGALQRNELFVVYQPSVDCRTMRPRGVEALVRWRHPEHGLIGPDRFVPLAEAGGLIDELTEQVLRRALDWFVPWCAADPARARLTLSVNLSAHSLGSRDFVDRMLARCAAAGISPGRLVFELTETAAMSDPVLALELMTRLRVHGFELSIDDVGTGFSSMLQLVRLPFSEMKVDRSFVRSLARSAESQAVVRAIVDLGHSLGLRTVGEGVEDDAALDFLRSVGCDIAQGYKFAPPLPAAELEERWPVLAGGAPAAAA
jgi:EAL domain-containing protein (putative c-di-GMP-specific phosphodiesterase class I)